MARATATSPPSPFILNHEEIHRRRWHAGLTLRELARVAGISESQLSRIESGKGGTHPGTLRRIAEALGCTSADFERRSA